MARLPVIKTLAGFDFSFQPSLDRNRITALAGLDFIPRAEVVHLLGPIDELSGSAADLLAALQSNLIQSHAGHRELMEEAMREPFLDAAR